MTKLEYFKRELIKILEKDENSDSIEKSFSYQVEMIMKGRVGFIGEIRIWNGKKYKKISNNKWVRIYDGSDKNDFKSINRSVGQIKRLIENATTLEELAKIVENNKEKFTYLSGEKKGEYLPVVQELMYEVSMKTFEFKTIYAPDGKDYFGTFTKDQGIAMGIENPGKIKLYMGNKDKGYLHMLKHEKDVQSRGYKNLQEFISDMCKNFVLIGKANDTKDNNKMFVLIKDDKKKPQKDNYLFLEFEIRKNKNSENEFIITSGGIYKNKKKRGDFKIVYPVDPTPVLSSGVIKDSSVHVGNNPITQHREPTSSTNLNLPSETKIVKKNTEKSVKTECKTIKELQNYARENYNIDIVYHGSAKTDSEECIKSFYEVEKMCKKLPGLNEYINTIEYINLGSKNNGVYSPDEYKIKIGNFQKNMEFEDFRFATGQDVTTVMQHEMTHAIQQYIFMNADEEDFRNMFENTRLGDKYIKRHRAMYKTLEDYKFNRPESFGVHKYKFYQSEIAKDIMNKAFKNLGMKPIKFGQKKETLYYIEKNPETGKYRYKKDSFTPEELAVLKVSFYSLSDPCELWSEAFTDYLQNGENAQPISKEIWKIVNEDYLNGELSKSILYIVKSILGEYVA